MNRRRVGLRGIGVIVAAAMVSGCGSGAKTTADTSIAIAIGGEPTTLDGQATEDGNTRSVVDANIFQTLMARTAGGQLVPLLASAAPQQQPDGKTWRFTLRAGVKFSNGEPFDAGAAVASIQRIIAPGFKSQKVDSVGTITGAAKVSALVVDVTTKAPDPILPSRMVLIEMVPPKASKLPGFAGAPVGTGPYKLASFAHGDHITLSANPTYWKAAPPVKTVTFYYPTTSGTRLAGLLSGKFDLITNLLPEDVSRAPQVITGPGAQHSVIELDQTSGVTSDLRVRQALEYAVDTKTLSTKLFEGNATPDNCQILASDWLGYNPNLQAVPYDPAKAKALLQAAHAVGKTITLTGESGKWLKDRDFTEAVGQYWRDAGLKVKTQILPFNSYLNVLLDKKRPQAVMVYHDNILADADRTMSTFYQPGAAIAANDESTLNRLVTDARTQGDSAKRVQDYQQAAKIGCDQALFYFGMRVKAIYGASKNLRWTPTALDDQALPVDQMALK